MVVAGDDWVWTERDEGQLQIARDGLRSFVVGNRWAPDVDALESRHKGLALRGTEATLVTVSKGTLRRYRKQGAFLLRRCVREELGFEVILRPGDKVGVAPLRFAEWVTEHKPRIELMGWMPPT